MSASRRDSEKERGAGRQFYGQAGMPPAQFAEMRGQDFGAKSIGRPDADHAAHRCIIRVGAAIGGQKFGFHALGVTQELPRRLR